MEITSPVTTIISPVTKIVPPVLEIVSPVTNGGWVDTQLVREQAQERQPAAAVEQKRDEVGRYRSYQEVPTNQAEESL